MDLEAISVAHCARDSRIGRDPFESHPDLPLRLWDHGCERVAVIRVTRQRFDVGDELASLRVLERCRDSRVTTRTDLLPC
jgi:hypothetical protein